MDSEDDGFVPWEREEMETVEEPTTQLHDHGRTVVDCWEGPPEEPEYFAQATASVELPTVSEDATGQGEPGEVSTARRGSSLRCAGGDTRAHQPCRNSGGGASEDDTRFLDGEPTAFCEMAPGGRRHPRCRRACAFQLLRNGVE